MPKIDKAMQDAGLGEPARADETPATAGHNGFGDKGAAYVARIENLNAEIEKERIDFTSRCQALRDDIKEIFEEAKSNGIAKGGVNAVVKARALERKAEAVRNKLNPDLADSYDQIRLKLGDLADTELGAAALARTQAGAETLNSLTN